jgi:hypothetical protein
MKDTVLNQDLWEETKSVPMLHALGKFRDEVIEGNRRHPE